jgi:hypothetical protein
MEVYYPPVQGRENARSIINREKHMWSAEKKNPPEKEKSLVR